MFKNGRIFLYGNDPGGEKRVFRLFMQLENGRNERGTRRTGKKSGPCVQERPRGCKWVDSFWSQGQPEMLTNTNVGFLFLLSVKRAKRLKGKGFYTLWG